MNRPLSFALLLSAALLSSCDLFQKHDVRTITGPLPNARIKFFNFAPSSPKLNFYAGDTKMTAVTSTTGSDTLGVVYPTAASGGLYAGIAAGQYTVSARLATPTDQNLAISNTPATIEDGKFYSYYLSGVYNTTTKTAEAFLVEDPIPAGDIDFTVASVRLVNAISNGTGDLTLYAKNPNTGVETAVGTAVAYKGAGAFVSVPFGVYDLSVRYSGSSTNLTSLSTQSFVGGHVYTISARGSTATTSTLGLSNNENQR
jgi:hypothetical protein